MPPNGARIPWLVFKHSIEFIIDLGFLKVVTAGWTLGSRQLELELCFWQEWSGRHDMTSDACADFIMGEAPKEGDESEQDEARPTKVVTEELTLEVRAPCLQLDYEGRSDGRSMATILTHIAPRHLVLCHGSTQASCLSLIAPSAVLRDGITLG